MRRLLPKLHSLPFGNLGDVWKAIEETVTVDNHLVGLSLVLGQKFRGIVSFVKVLMLWIQGAEA
jgi:hypothetical protein